MLLRSHPTQKNKLPIDCLVGGFYSHRVIGFYSAHTFPFTDLQWVLYKLFHVMSHKPPKFFDSSLPEDSTSFQPKPIWLVPKTCYISWPYYRMDIPYMFEDLLILEETNPHLFWHFHPPLEALFVQHWGALQGYCWKNNVAHSMNLGPVSFPWFQTKTPIWRCISFERLGDSPLNGHVLFSVV